MGDETGEPPETHRAASAKWKTHTDTCGCPLTPTCVAQAHAQTHTHMCAHAHTDKIFLRVSTSMGFPPSLFPNLYSEKVKKEKKPREGKSQGSDKRDL